ncbi:MAG TPA: DUF2914 domain-containing protein [Burkholderiales bacterium]|nr:DUF2914 domain-containing protein [Burkholderiales bacterium]
MSESAPTNRPELPATRLHRLKHYYESHEQAFDIAAFVGGFLFDIAMLDRIDAWATIIQQALYLVLIAVILLQMFFAENPGEAQITAMSRLKRWYYQYRVPFVHFLLGTLLNLYTLFFFKSASLFVSLGFMVVLALLLVANESKHLKSRGVTFKFALFSLCLLSFCAAIVPVFVRSIGLFVFLLSMLVACVPMAVMYRRILIHAPERAPQARQQVLMPFGIVLVAFLALYLVRLIPPVPLSIPFIGVYHNVERSQDEYRLSHERPFWKIWHHGDQDFLAQPGDKLFVYFRIFSPARFSDQVLMRWYWKDPAAGWKLHDSIPIRIVGGREEGFRGYGMKTNYQPGDWKLQVETTDEREIGRIYFTVASAPAAPREFEVDVQ